MNKPEDSELHDLIRSKINDYQPDYQQTDWVAMRSKLEPKRQPSWILISVFCLVLGGTAGWLLTTKSVIETNTKIVLVEKINTNKIIPKTESLVTKVNNRDFKTKKRPDLDHNSENAKTTQYNKLPTITTTDIQISVLQSTHLEPLAGLASQTPQVDLQALTIEIEITKQLSTGAFGTDSTAFKVFERNVNRWKNAIVVCDFTSSMYPYSTQLYAWLKKNENNPNIRAMVFFTDCDSSGQEIQKSKAAGKMFTATNLNFENLLPTMIEAARNTKNNTDDPENNIEALLFAQKQFPTAENLILIADNSTTVKGMNQLSKIKKPVHIVLCGTTFDTTVAIQPHYFKIAARTRGSLHTSEDDIQNPNDINKDTWIRVGNRFYRFRNDDFETTDFQKRPRRFLKLFWF